MPVQTVYTMKPAAAYDGLKADMSDGVDLSKTVETAPISFGRVVSIGSTDERVVLGGSAPFGISVRQLELEGGIPQVGERIAVRTRGRINASVDGAGSLGDALNFVVATGVLTTAAVSAGVIAVMVPATKLSESKGTGTAIVTVQVD